MTELRAEGYELPAADLGPENPLPMFRGEDEDSKFELNPNVPEDDLRYMGYRTAHRVLPYRMQDGYNRRKKPRVFHAIVLENDHLRATFLPELGGHLMSLLHKADNRELLDRNPVFQPANLALRGAWISGGIEWNATLPGHYYLTCSPVFAARVATSSGYPVLRIYEWDRVRCFPWQIDFHLPPDSPFLFSHVRLVNPHDTDMAAYWWTNMAVEEKPNRRVLFPADTIIGFTDERTLGLVKMPIVRGADGSYSTNSPFAQEMFSRIEDGQRRWITQLDAEGKGLFESSTDRLRGRKMFSWGMNPGGRRWQEFLSAPGRAYVEIQCGLARTQLECLPMPPHEQWTWTEAFGLLEADPAKVHAPDWNAAWRAADAAIESLLPRARVDALDADFAKVSDQPPEEIIAQGSGWGTLERIRLARAGAPDRIPAALPFSETDLGPEETMWRSLLETGALPKRDPGDDPGPAMVQPEWREMLEHALEGGHGDHWLAWLHLGIMRLEAQDVDGARAAWERSLALCRSGWALRNLSVIEQRAGNSEAERQLLREAWETGPKIPALALEYAAVLVRASDLATLNAFVQELPEDVRNHERMQIYCAQAALERGDLDTVEKLFDHDFATIREGEVTLTDLWFALHERRLAAQENIPIDDHLRTRVRQEFPPPRRIDFRIAADVK